MKRRTPRYAKKNAWLTSQHYVMLEVDRQTNDGTAVAEAIILEKYHCVVNPFCENGSAREANH